MNLNDMKLQIEKIEKLIFLNSLYKNLSLKESADTHRNLIILRNQFLSSSFSEMALEELEGIRYRIVERILSVKIEIREMAGLNCENENKELEGLLMKKL